jgi:hypothetical protein
MKRPRVPDTESKKKPTSKQSHWDHWHVEGLESTLASSSRDGQPENMGILMRGGVRGEGVCMWAGGGV